VPAVLSTIGAQGSVLVNPIFKEISEVFREVTRIDRTTTAAWSDPNFRGRRRGDGPQEARRLRPPRAAERAIARQPRTEGSH
jgi:hypothetical protein